MPSHQCVTARMGREPAANVVDVRLPTHDHLNLYVTVASTPPRFATVNPELTIAALSLRAA